MLSFQPKFQEIIAFPPSIVHLELENDILEFMDKANKILHDTGMPIIPFAFCHALLPFSPICSAYICDYLRKTRLETLLHQFNDAIDEKGIFLEWNEYFHIGFSDNESPGTVVQNS